MKFCPTCREEFLDYIDFCAACDENLVDDDKYIAPTDTTIVTQEEIMSGTMAAFLEGSIGNCREVERILASKKLPCIIYPINIKGEGDQNTLGTTADTKYVLLVRENDVEQAKLALQHKFYEDVAKEGQGFVTAETINLDHEEITCPACNERGALKNGECATCGLYLAAT